VQGAVDRRPRFYEDYQYDKLVRLPDSNRGMHYETHCSDRIKLLWWDGQGFCLFYKILERGYFPWPTAKEQAAKLESQEAEVSKRDSIIGLLRAQLELLRHRQHGPSSEKIDRKIEQFELMLEEIEASRAEAEMRSGKNPLPELDDAFEKPKRKPLPDGLPTEERVYAAPCNCPTCGGTSFLKAADKVVQVMEHVPASVKVVRHVEKRMICRDCDTTVSGEMPILPIERGKPGPGLLAHIMVAKFDDHIPLYRLSEMYDRLGIDISRSVMADWVGRVSVLLAPLILLIRAHIAAVGRIHTDDTPVDVLDPGRGRTKTGRVWVYVFDGSGYQDTTPGAIAYYYSPTVRARIRPTISQEALRQPDRPGRLHGACAPQVP